MSFAAKDPKRAVVRIAIITDLHYGEPSALPARRSEISDLLCEKAVDYLNTEAQPNVTVVLGDLIDRPDAPESIRRLEIIRAILERLHSPSIVLPGNHDPDPAVFYTVFRKPAPIEQIDGCRFLPFVDSFEPGYNARRGDEELRRITEAREGFEGHIVCLQHVNLSPPGSELTPYNYTNAGPILSAMAQARVSVSVSGHYHAGVLPFRSGPTTLVNAPAVCEAPFPISIMDIVQEKARGVKVTVTRRFLGEPKRGG